MPAFILAKRFRAFEHFVLHGSPNLDDACSAKRLQNRHVQFVARAWKTQTRSYNQLPLDQKNAWQHVNSLPPIRGTEDQQCTLHRSKSLSKYLRIRKHPKADPTKQTQEYASGRISFSDRAVCSGRSKSTFSIRTISPETEIYFVSCAKNTARICATGRRAHQHLAPRKSGRSLAGKPASRRLLTIERKSLPALSQMNSLQSQVSRTSAHLSASAWSSKPCNSGTICARR